MRSIELECTRAYLSRLGSAETVPRTWRLESGYVLT